MAKKFIYTALAGVSLLFAGCSEDLVGDYVQPTEKHFGEEIMFGGSASYDVDSKGTRTIYGGYGEIADGKEPVYWIQGDKVRLYCPDAAVKTADYSVTATATATDTTGRAAKTDLSKIGDAGLQWGVPTARHTFYGVYPIPADESLKEGTTLTGTIPDVQKYKDYTTTDGNVVYNPNMEYAYMVAKTVVNKPNEMPASVYMKFTPIATAVEIELQNDANEKAYDFREVHLSSTNHYLSGTFTADLGNMELGENSNDNVRYGTGCPTSITYGADAEKQVAVHLYTEGGAAMTLPAKKTLTFTIFMMPSNQAASDTDVIDDLKITLITSDGNKTGTLQNISIKKSKKNYMHMMPIGGDMTYNQSEWIKYVEDTKTLNELSIPGAGGAASGINNDGTTGAVGLTSELWGSNANYYEQSLSIEELWKSGIRCFEFTVDYVDSFNEDGTPVTDSNLSNNIVYCNAQSTGMTLDECISKVKTLLGQYPDEFAMVIITYQQQSGWNLRKDDGSVSQTRNPATFMSQFNTYWTNLAMPEGTKKALYSSDLTVESARGSLFCIARPTSQGEDNYAVVETTSSWGNYILNTTTYSQLEWDENTDVAENILVIHGWGALKDKWYVRGYTDCIYFRMGGNKHFDVLLNGKDNLINDVAPLTSEQLVNMLGYRSDRATKPGRPFDVASSSTGASETLKDEYANVATTSQLNLTPDFTYSTITNADDRTLSTSTFAWVQEWARVSKTSQPYNSYEGYAYWVSSIDEKKAHITDCLTRSIGKAETDKTIYINSLCGYYIMNGTDDVSKQSASANSLTECNVANSLENTFRGDWKFNPLTGANNLAGMCGDIASFASDINSFFLTELNKNLTADNRLGGSTGIVLMDRVSNKDAGAAIPSIIIANNFSSDYEATDPTTPTSVVTDGDTPLSREGVNIVWGEWE